MEELFLKSLPQLGVGVVAVLAIVYISKLNAKERGSNQKAFMEYVENHNHQVTKLVVESTKAIGEASEHIKESTQVMRDLYNKIK